MDRAILGGSRGVTVTLGAAVLALLAFAAPSANAVVVMALSLAFAVMLAAARSIVVPWYRVVALILMVVLFIPIDRYQLPGSLPFNLELYRVVIALCIAAWFVSILADPTVRLTRTTFDGPLALIG